MRLRESISDDLYRLAGSRSTRAFIRHFFLSHGFRYIVFFRMSRSNRFNRIVSRVVLMRMRGKYGLEISPSVQIGRGLHLEHPFSITLNSQAQLGDNITIYKGVTVGSELRGKRTGVPTIGNHVFLGINSVILGGITIGDNVLIAANAFVNFDVPPNSVVLGNPAKIMAQENATQGYLKNPIAS